MFATLLLPTVISLMMLLIDSFDRMLFDNIVYVDIVIHWYIVRKSQYVTMILIEAIT